MNYYERHIGDYLRDASHLSLLEHGVYARLLDVYYTEEVGLEEGMVARRIGAKTDEELAALRIVLMEFFVLQDGVYTQARCDREIERYQNKQCKARASAVASWESRRALPAQSEGNATAMQSQSDGNALQSPDTSLQTPKKRVAAGSRLPTNFVPHWDFAVEQGIADPALEVAKFRDYWNAQPGQKGVKTDWPATWRNWCRNANKGARDSPMTFRERDAANAAARVHEMTGGLVSAKAAIPITRHNDVLSEVFDATPRLMGR